MNRIVLTYIVCFVIMVALGAAQLQAAEEAGGKTTKVIKEVQGEVSGIGYNTISVTYNRDAQKGTEEEILLPYDAAIQMVHKKNMKEINVGDTVLIQFEETTEAAAAGLNVSRKAVKLSFVKPAAPAPQEPAEPQSEPVK